MTGHIIYIWKLISLSNTNIFNMKRIYYLCCIIAFISITNSLSGQNIINKQAVTGSWLGKINTGAIELRIIFNLSVVGNDSLVATLDSPDQGAKGIKLGPVTYNIETIKISAAAMLAEYNGTLKNDTLFEGTWKQAGKTFPLNLSRLRTAFTLRRPQEPAPPFPYRSEDVTFSNEKFDIKLAGTLTVPSGKGPFPAVIMITGSGAQNRNEELMGHKPFLVIADYLSRNGIAVLRYDDRGIGKSQGSYATATSADLATDAEAAFLFLKNNPEINPKAIGLAGHSEGGLIAPIVASSNREIGFIISLAGPGVSGDEIIIRQSADIMRASGSNEKDIKEAAEINRKLYSILKKEPDNKKASEKMGAVYKKSLEKKKITAEETEKEMTQFQAGISQATSPWFRYFIATNPSAYWKKVKCPVLALNGSLDLQVSAEVNLPAIEKALKSSGNTLIKTVKLQDLNHLFQHCKTGMPTEYGNIEETFSPEALKIMADWINGL
jgi:uncharacterized protein